MAKFTVDTVALSGAGSTISHLSSVMPSDTSISADGCGSTDVEDAVREVAFWGVVLWANARTSLDGLALSATSAAQLYEQTDQDAI